MPPHENHYLFSYLGETVHLKAIKQIKASSSDLVIGFSLSNTLKYASCLNINEHFLGIYIMCVCIYIYNVLCVWACVCTCVCVCLLTVSYLVVHMQRMRSISYCFVLCFTLLT